MNDALILLLSGMSGAALGIFFFGGLWWTVRRGANSAYPALWFFGSLLLRTGIVLAGFYGVAGTHWQRLLLCLLGFTLARIAVTRATRTIGTAPTEAHHAP